MRRQRGAEFGDALGRQNAFEDQVAAAVELFFQGGERSPLEPGRRLLRCRCHRRSPLRARSSRASWIHHMQLRAVFTRHLGARREGVAERATRPALHQGLVAPEADAGIDHAAAEYDHD